MPSGVVVRTVRLVMQLELLAAGRDAPLGVGNDLAVGVALEDEHALRRAVRASDLLTYMKRSK